MDVTIISLVSVTMILSLIIWIVRAIFFPKKTPYFKEGSEQQTKLFVAVYSYLSEWYPSLLCDCEGDIEIFFESQMNPKTRYHVIFDFLCHETCNLNHQRIGFIVDTSDPIEIQVISPTNESKIKRYRKNLIE